MFSNFILPRPRYLYVILVGHNELPEDDILNVETCRKMLFVIIVFDIFVMLLIRPHTQIVILINFMDFLNEF